MDTPNPTPATPPPATPPQATPPPATPPPATPPAAPANLMDDGTPPATPPPATPATPPEITDEAIGSFIGELPAVDLGTDAAGNKIEFDSAAVKAIAPAMMKHGLKPEQAKDIVGAYAEYQKARYAEQVQAEQTAVTQLAEATRTELGKDLPTFVADAKKGGAALFGPELWAQLKAIPAFANDVRVIKALAAYGRSIKTDDGAGTPGGGSKKDEGFTADGWIKNSNRT